ncbi:hypothetical protein JCM1841_003511 [Sporobolomyces salmonicolor]
MSSQKTSKTDLLVRVRYQNPLPPPPFPPRLLHIPTTPARYATYEFLNPIQSERDLPMILDAELGLPLEYGKPKAGGRLDAEYWLGNRDTIAPKGAAPPLADEDAFLLEDPTSRTGATNAASSMPNVLSMPGTPGGSGAAGAMESKKVDGVSWLRRTEYLSSEAGVGGNKAINSGFGTPKRTPLAQIGPQDRDSRARFIASTFSTAHTPLTELRHPTKPHLVAEEAFDFLPDGDLWANQYDLIRFGEDPATKTGADLQRAGPNPRLPRAIFRDLSDLPEGDQRVAFYLPQDDATATKYTKQRLDGGESGEDQTFDFRWIRDYETTSTRPLQHEYIVSFDAGPDATEAEAKVKPRATGARRKGAYYAPVGSVLALRKRRPRKGEDPRVFPPEADEELQFWDGITVQLMHKESVLDEQGLQEWQGYKDEVERPPMYLVQESGAAEESKVANGTA